MLGTILRATFLFHLLLLVCNIAAAPVGQDWTLYPIHDDAALMSSLQSARAEEALRRLQEQRGLARSNTFLPRMREAPTVAASEGSSTSGMRWPWFGSGAASTDEEINKLLTASPVPQAGKRASINPATVGRTYKAVKLPGDGMDAEVIRQMKLQRKPFFVQGAKDRVWLLTLTSDLSTYRATRQEESIAVFVRDAIKKSPIPTVAIHNTAMTQHVATAARSAEADAPLWEQLSDAWFGKVSQDVKFIRPA